MNRLILIRHGQSEHHVQGLTGGWTDTPLTPLGNAQARAAAERCKQLIRNEPAPPLYSSDLLRAAQTAEHVAAAIGRNCRLEPGLREINNGIAAGMRWEEAKKIELPETEPALHWVPYDDAESAAMMTERVFAAMERLANSCPGAAIVVTHGIAGVAVIQWWLRLGTDARQGISFELDAASITELGINARNQRTIVRLNDTAHLESRSRFDGTASP